jgi:hypothetical protein
METSKAGWCFPSPFRRCLGCALALAPRQLGQLEVISVKFGTHDATSVTTKSPTRIKATAPLASQPGKVSVLVTTKVGTATGDFTYT